MALILCDTDVLIDALRGRGEVERFRDEYRRGRLATSSISVFELLSGAAAPEERRRVEDLLLPLERLPFDEASARRAATARIALESAGRSIGAADLQIAGICLAREMPLWTRNRGHFERIEGLSLFPPD